MSVGLAQHDACGDVAVRVGGRLQFVDSGWRAACSKHSLTRFHVFVLEVSTVSRHETFMVLLPFYYFLLCFTSYSYLDFTPSPFVIVQCLETD
jgi:hypothetical protein